MPIAPVVKVSPAQANANFIARAISRHAKLQPDQIAVAADSGSWTFKQLETYATQLANHLQARGLKRQQVVAICLERSPEFIAAALSILKCGAAYLPIDPAHPAKRLRFIIKDAGANLIITSQRLAGTFSESQASIVSLDVDLAKIAAAPTEWADVDLAPNDLAYVIYTSGSTGEPKGVEITHRNLANLIDWHIRAFELDRLSRATFQAGVGFDAAVWEIWPHLAAGASLYLPEESTRLSAEKLRDWMVAHEITISFVPTALAEQMIALSWPAKTALRFLLTGADTLHRHPPADLPFALVNNYGPTECTVVTTSGTISPPQDRESPSIGFPIDRVHVHLVGEDGREVSAGEAGEIYIGGEGVARGYRNRPALNAEAFVSDPFCADGGRLYRTGDRARCRSNGEIEFLGRIDQQIKIRGYRIEPGEIEAILLRHPSVQRSVVMAREDALGEKRLVAYIVSAPGSQPDERALRDAIRQSLPDYMEPAAFVWLESFPLTSNGKIDRAALPPPKAGDEKNLIAPASPVEQTLAGIICQVLKLPRVSTDDDFFHLGAHSLLGAQIIAQVQKGFGVELKLLDVFNAPTVTQLSQKIEEALMRKIEQMSEAEVDAALADFNEAAPK